MQRIAIFLFFIFYSTFFITVSHAQIISYKVAVFSPIYIDSVFDGSNYKLGNNNLPKNMLPGLEFYNGVLMAIDSLKAEGVSVEINIYDSKSSTTSIAGILQKEEMQNVGLIIASFTNRTELKLLADYAAYKQIPLVSATYPNDGGITNNPYFILINSTLRTHCEELYKHVQRYYATGNLILFTRKGAVETLIQSVFSDMGRQTPSIPLKIKTIELTDTFSVKQVATYLDSTKQNTIICGTTDEAFGLRLIKTLNSLKPYQSLTIGMPTWDGIKMPDNNSDEKPIETIYSTPYNFSKTNSLYNWIAQKYKLMYNAHPTDIMLKGYETVYHFTHLYITYGSELMLNHLSEKKYNLFNYFDINAVRNKADLVITDYYENRKLYFIKKQGNVVKSVY